ncbi:MAG: hypothetical protein ABMA26_03055 [Limisphaerales bacterium]
MSFIKQALFLVLAGFLVFSGCRRKSGAGPADTAGPVEPTTPAPEAAAPATAPAAGATAALPPPDAEVTPAVESRFRSNDPKQPYAPPLSGSYQAQLDLYNRVLRKWAQDQGYTPDTMQAITASYGTPKPPQPPAGRTLVYDRKTVTVSLQ